MMCDCSSQVAMLDVSAAILDKSFKTSTPFKNSHSVSLITVSVDGVHVLKLLSRMAILAVVFVLQGNVVTQ